MLLETVPHCKIVLDTAAAAAAAAVGRCCSTVTNASAPYRKLLSRLGTSLSWVPVQEEKQQEIQLPIRLCHPFRFGVFANVYLQLGYLH